MRIKVNLNRDSIKKAVKKLNSVKKLLPKMWNEFLEKCAVWVIQRANENLALYSDVGINVIQDISDNWTFNIENGKVTIINTSDKAVFVEFGVGIVGQGDAHPSAATSGYEYNVESTSKNSSGEWHFFRNADDLDLPEGSYYTDWVTGNYEDRRRMHIWTRGAVGAMYAYNAMQDLITTGTAEKFWKEIRERYL